jgi:hypothetical protein
MSYVENFADPPFGFGVVRILSAAGIGRTFMRPSASRNPTRIIIIVTERQYG